MEKFSCIVVILGFLFKTGQTFPNSAPTAACSDMLPGHTPTNEIVRNPFRIDVESSSYRLNGRVQVTISSLFGNAESFKGILVQARSVNTGLILGTWEPPSIPGLTTMSCSNANDAVTHSDRSIKTTPVTLDWNAPLINAGTIIFSVTIVKEYSVFWVALSSNIIVPFGSSLCLATPCKNAGECRDIFGNIRCTCPPGYQGDVCEVPPGSNSACDPSPCRNEGQCYSNGKCACPTNYFGDYCQFNAPKKEFCFLNTCQNGGLCVLEKPRDSTLVKEVCVCPVGYAGDYCETKVGPGLCGGVDCGLGECLEEPTTTTGFYCNCPRTHTGSRCELPVCSRYPCRNGGTCSLLDNVVSGYECLCPPFFTGPTCQSLGTASGPCAYNPCGTGTCTERTDTYTCTCPTSHSGANCQNSVCSSLPCYNTGKCVHDAYSDRGYVCDCPATYTGDNCEDRVVCNPDPCYNGGYCSEDPFSQTGYSCNCPPTFTGTRCQNVNHCDPNPCINNGNCQLSSSSDTNYICNCVGGYTGEICQTPPAIDYCNPSPCSTNGFCLSEEDGNGFYCLCFPGYTGPTCQIIIQPGTDRPTIPPPPVTIPTIPPDVTFGLVCTPNPCLNSGECYANNTSPLGFSCKCLETYHGPTCATEVSLCEVFNPCENDGVCIEEDYSCVCDPRYRGPVCQFPVSGNCSGAIDLCIHGKCTDGDNGLFFYTCECDQGASGINCEIKDPCDPDPCGPQGTCVSYPLTGGFNCDCETGYTGDTCEESTGGGFQSFLELFFTYWPIGLGIIVLIITIIICWIGCHFTKEDRQKKKAATAKRTGQVARKVNKGKKKKARRGSDDSDIELEGTYQI